MLHFSRRSLLGKVLLSTSLGLVTLFLITGWLVQRQAVVASTRMIEEEAQSGFQAYESLWRARAAMLASVSRVLSGMSDVRAAFSTGDDATIRDTAGELWSRISASDAVFLVADPTGRVIASLGGGAEPFPARRLSIVPAASRRFPEQTSGFLLEQGRLYQIVITPVYIQSPRGPALLNVLVAGYRVDSQVADQLEQATAGTVFIFAAGDQVLASSLDPARSVRLATALEQSSTAATVSDGASEYVPLAKDLHDIEGRPIASLLIFRSFDAARAHITALRTNILLIFLAALALGLGLTHALARRIVAPVRKLDRAAAEVARQNYSARVEVAGEDELGRLARTFNTMCESLEKARDELIRQERISTIGRMATSIVHDLRNPLAAVYGGAEMLVDSDLPPQTTKRLAGNIYRASKTIQTMLQDLTHLSSGRTRTRELCHLSDLVEGGIEPLIPMADAQGIAIETDIPASLEVSVQRGRVERVFGNLVTNALEAIPGPGQIRITAKPSNGSVTVTIADSGPGISPALRERLFQPFATADKKNGLGLGLALSRQTMLDQGGDLWEDSAPGQGARFQLRFPQS